MSRATTRKSAVDQARKHDGQPALDADAEGPGLRDWFGSLGRMSAMAAAFDTRLAGPAMFTGSAAKGIAKLLERHGFTLIAEAESFLVTSGQQAAAGRGGPGPAMGPGTGRQGSRNAGPAVSPHRTSRP